MRRVLASPPRVDCRLECVSGQYLPSVPREDQANSGSWTSVLANLAGAAHWHGDQAHQEKTACPDHAADGLWGVGASREAAPVLARGHGPQYGYYPPLEWHLSRTAGQLDAQISSCCSSSPSACDDHVSDR